MVEAAERGKGRTEDGQIRSVAQLNMLHSLAAKLNRLGDVQEIGEEITNELHTIIDYHSCRVYILQPDGVTLKPVAFQGALFSDYEHETYEGLVTSVGEGITGHVAQYKESLLTPDANEVPFAVVIPGTSDDILESMLAVPMLVGPEVIGVIVLSSLGYGQFDEEDQRMLEVLASHAAVAFENAKLFQAEREAAETSSALLRLSQALTGMHSTDAILQEAVDTTPDVISCSAVGAYVRDEDTGIFGLRSIINLDRTIQRPREEIQDVPANIAEAMIQSNIEPYVISTDLQQEVPFQYHLVNEPRQALIAPVRWEPDGAGAIAILAPAADARFEDRDLRLARGIADLTSLALGNARRLHELERFHELVETIDAVFWEADPVSREFRFLSKRAGQMLGIDRDSWLEEGRRWGEHVVAEDRDAAVSEFLAAAADHKDRSLEYRMVTHHGRTTWLRDLVHVAWSGGRERVLRGLMVDVTERKRAEQALRRSERKYSEAFRREREASQRLRALDAMKNTFLEAVSHDLRTPLTSILGSALTLEQGGSQLEGKDAADLVHRIAANARKLERLLSDLLDLDRLQRGIITPQRRPTDLEGLVRRSVEETDRSGRHIELDLVPMTISIDAAKVERILENLVSNAMRYTPEGAHIWIRTRAQDGGALLIVEDDGPGVPKELREAIFEPFRQAPGSAMEHSPGVGVGLSLVRRFAELHGGRAWVQDRRGGGASFRVHLPEG
jgi:PAS domain S-box-containing protein